VCEAVEFAHRNLVVHRDLKPDNILVAGDGTPRLLDFGTAKLLGSTSEESAPEITRKGLQLFTPQYASPEQVLGEPITTATDIYSLGVLMYLLTAGVPPYLLKEFNTAEMLRVICNDPPPRPSSVVNLSRSLDADLDAIVMKALRKEPLQRYATIDQLSTDIAAYLDGRPIRARRGTLQYRASKFIRRNRVAFVAAVLLLMTGLAGMSGVLWQSRSANLQRQRAEARSEDLRQLSDSLLSELDQALKDIPGSTEAQKLLVTRVTERLDGMARDTRGDRQMELDLIDAYTRLGDVQGDVYEQNVANPAGALASYGKALALAQPLAAAHPDDQETLSALGMALEDRGEELTAWGTADEAVASLRLAVATYDRLISLPRATPRMIFEAATAYEALGDELAEDEGLADVAAGVAAYRRTADLDERAHRLDPGYMPASRGLATIQLKIGNAQLDDDPAQAINELRDGLQKLDALPTDEKKKLGLVRTRALFLRKQAVALSNLGDYAGARVLFTQATEVFQRLSDADPKEIRGLGDLSRLFDNEIDSYRGAGSPVLGASSQEHAASLRMAEQLLDQRIVILKRIIVQDPTRKDWKQELAGAQITLGAVKHDLHQNFDVQSVKTGLALLTSAASGPHVSLSSLDLAIDALLDVEPDSLRSPAQAVEYAQRGVSVTHSRSALSFLELSQAYRAVGKETQAIQAAHNGLSLLPDAKSGPPSHLLTRLNESKVSAPSR
jgi:tetratricopeptide (TPR) repeat protein